MRQYWKLLANFHRKDVRTPGAGIDAATTKFDTRVARKLSLPMFPVFQLVVLIVLPNLETSDDERWAMSLSWADS